jgi:Sulfotransferase domain
LGQSFCRCTVLYYAQHGDKTDGPQHGKNLLAMAPTTLDRSNGNPNTSIYSSRRLDHHNEKYYVSKLNVLFIALVYCFGFYAGSVHCGYTIVTVMAPSISSSNTVGESLLTSVSASVAASYYPKTATGNLTTHTLAPSNNNPPKVVTKLRPNQLKLPTPIIVMGLPKAGITSIYGFFQCGLTDDAKLSHYDCKPGTVFNPDKIGMACGKRMRRNLEKYKVTAFDGMDTFHVYTELDSQEKQGGITLPQWRYLQEMHDHYPNATWILNTRDEQSWLQSVDKWKDLRQRFINHHIHPEFPGGVGKKDEEMINFYRLQARRVRDFVSHYPSHSLVQVQIDSPNAGKVMEDAFGITKDCWGVWNANSYGTWTSKAAQV